MTALIGALRVSLSAETAAFESGMRRARSTAASSSASIAKSLGAMKAGLVGLASGLSVGLLARGFLAAADAAKQMDAQLRLATASSGNFAKAQQDVARIAQETRTGLQETAQLYATFQRSAAELGINQAQAARATETVSKAFQISGASAAEAAGGLRQFLQGIQSGTLRGEELNSVLENAPRLARLVAESLGVTIGELRAMGKEGEITGDKLIKALTDRKFTDAIDKEFKELPVTFDQAMTQVTNAAIITFGAFDRGGEFSKALVNFISDGADGFDDLARRAEDLGITIRATMEGLGDVFEPMLDGAMSVFGQIRGEALSLRDSIASLFGAFDDLANALPRLGNMAKGFDNRVFGTNWKPDQLSDTRGKFLKGYNQSQGQRRLRMLTDRDANSRLFAELGIGTGAPARVGGGGGSDKKDKKGRAKKDDSERRRIEALRDAYRFDQDLRRSQMDVLRAQQALSTDYVERARISIELLNLEKQGYEAELTYQVAAKEITQAQADQLRIEYDKRDALEREKVLQDEQVRRRQEYAELEQLDLTLERDLLESQSQLAETAADQRAVQLRLLELAYRQERTRLEAILADEQSTWAAKEEARRRLANLAKTEQNDRAGVIQGTRGPMEDFFSRVPQTAAEVQEAMEALKVQGIEGAIDSILALTEGFDSFRETAVSAIKQIVAELIRMQLMKLALNLFGGAMSGGASAGSASLGAMPDLSAGLGLSGSAINLGGMKFNSGGGFNVLGRHGVDRNVLQLNGLPVAKVSHGERISVSNDNAKMMGGHTINVSVPGGMDPRAARQTGMQIASEIKRSLGEASRKGY